MTQTRAQKKRRVYPRIWVNRMERYINPRAIVVCRFARRWSQQDLADYIGVERSTVYRWEHGQVFPAGRNADRLALLIGRTNREIRTHQLKPPPGFDRLLEQTKDAQDK